MAAALSMRLPLSGHCSSPHLRKQSAMCPPLFFPPAGVDFDLESFSSGLAYPPLTADQTIQWIVDASTAARSVLCPMKFVFHAPQVRSRGGMPHEVCVLRAAGASRSLIHRLCAHRL